MNEMLANALAYAARGWYVFPCHSTRDGRCTCGRADCDSPGKHPCIGRGMLAASNNAERIRAWWKAHQYANIGVYCQASGLVVLDVDPEHGGLDSLDTLVKACGPEAFETLTHRTGGGGVHYIYLALDGAAVKNATNWLPGIDTRTKGYIIAPPSRHVSGNSYEVLADRDSAPLPDALIAWFLAQDAASDTNPPHRSFQTENVGSIDAYALAALDAETHRVRTATEGNRNNALNRAAFSLGQLCGAGALSAGVVRHALLEAASAWPGRASRRETEKTLESGLNAGMSQPRAIPERPAQALNGNHKTSVLSEKTASINAFRTQAVEVDVTPKSDGPNLPKSVNAVAEAWAKHSQCRYLYTSNNQWWEYGGGLWRMVDDPYIERDVRNLALAIWGNALSPKILSNIVRMARLLLLRDFREMGGASNLIPFRNGVFDVRTNDFTEHSPDLLLTRQLPYDYDPSADCPKFRKFVDDVLLTKDGETCREWVQVMQEWFGYLLLADSSAQTAMVWLGKGANGKGVMAKVMEALVGRDQSIAVAVDQLKDPYHRADLFGKMLGVTGDLDRADMKHAAGWFKAIVGGDTISARHPGGRVFHFVPTLRLAISCNDLPDTSDMSYGYFRRLLIIQFRLEVPDSQKVLDLPEQLIAELSGIFNWALEGLRRFEAAGRHFTRAAESDDVKAEYRAQQDPIAGFLLDCCDRSEDEGCWEWSESLYAAYRRWCFGQDIKPVLSYRRFSMGLNRNGIQASEDGWDKARGTNRKLRKGVCVRPEA